MNPSNNASLVVFFLLKISNNSLYIGSISTLNCDFKKITTFQLFPALTNGLFYNYYFMTSQSFSISCDINEPNKMQMSTCCANSQREDEIFQPNHKVLLPLSCSNPKATSPDPTCLFYLEFTGLQLDSLSGLHKNTSDTML